MPKRVCIKNANARNFYLILEKCKTMGISYYIPKNVDEECRDYDVVISDGPSQSVVEVDKKRFVYVPYDSSREAIENVIEDLVLMLHGVRERRKAVIGIDIGRSRYGVAVLVEHSLVYLDTTDERGVLSLVEKYSNLGFSDILVKIGVTNSNLDDALRLGEEIQRRFKIRVGLVDESWTTHSDIKPRRRKVRRDENAAYNISLREPFVIYKP